MDLTQEEDADLVSASLGRTKNAKGEPLKMTWLNVHSRIWHDVFDSHKVSSPQNARLRASYAASCGKIRFKAIEAYPSYLESETLLTNLKLMLRDLNTHCAKFHMYIYREMHMIC